MSSRLDQEREEQLQPARVQSCKKKLESLGFKVTLEGETKLVFDYKDSPVNFFPYSGWHSGKTIQDGRGFSNLLKQLKASDEI